MNDDARRSILRRRARFVAAAVASAGFLSAAAPRADETGADASDAADAETNDTAADAVPAVCLSPLPPKASGDGGCGCRFVGRS